MKISSESKFYLVFLISASLVLFSALAASAQTESDKKTIVTVNDIPVYEAQLNNAMSMTFGYQAMMTLYKNQQTRLLGYLQTNEAQAMLKLFLLNQILVEELKNNKIDELNLTVSDEEVETELDELIENNDNIKDRENLTEMLKQQQVTMEQLKNSLKNNLLQTKLRDEMVGEVEVSQEKIKSYYEENKQSFEKDEEGEVKPLEEVSDKIENTLSNQKKNEEYDKWLKEFKGEAEVEFSEDFTEKIEKDLPGLKIKEVSFLNWIA